MHHTAGRHILTMSTGLARDRHGCTCQHAYIKTCMVFAGCLALLKKVMASSPQIIATPATTWEVTWPYCSGKKERQRSAWLPLGNFSAKNI